MKLARLTGEESFEWYEKRNLEINSTPLRELSVSLANLTLLSVRYIILSPRGFRRLETSAPSYILREIL